MSLRVLCINWRDTGHDDRGGCAIGEHGGEPTVRQCIDCRKRVRLVRIPPKPAKWPLLVRAVARLRQPGEIGIGDTLTRIIEGVEGDTLAAWYERVTGQDCGCSDRRERLNARFPYPER